MFWSSDSFDLSILTLNVLCLSWSIKYWKLKTEQKKSNISGDQKILAFKVIISSFTLGLQKTNDWAGKIAHFWRYVKMDPTSLNQLFEPNKNCFIALPFIFCRLPTNWHLSEKIHTPAPGKKLVLDLRPENRHIPWKNNSKQFLLRCCYTYFRPFAHKSRLHTRVVGHKIVICGQTNENEYSSTRAKIA